MKRLFFILLLFLTFNSFADEQIVDFTENSLPVLNNELRQNSEDIEDIDTRVTAIEDDDFGQVRQVVHTQDGTTANGNTLIPEDNTKPQKTEGDEYMTLAITPTSATNELKIEVVVVGGTNADTNYIVALFQDDTADALAAVYSHTGGNTSVTTSFIHYMTAGTTSATTFKVRAGNTAAGTFYFNGNAATQYFNGVCASSITITEVEP